jgi:hypothetical protein
MSSSSPNDVPGGVAGVILEAVGAVREDSNLRRLTVRSKSFDLVDAGFGIPEVA